MVTLAYSKRLCAQPPRFKILEALSGFIPLSSKFRTATSILLSLDCLERLQDIGFRLEVITPTHKRDWHRSFIRSPHKRLGFIHLITFVVSLHNFHTCDVPFTVSCCLLNIQSVISSKLGRHFDSRTMSLSLVRPNGKIRLHRNNYILGIKHSGCKMFTYILDPIWVIVSKRKLHPWLIFLWYWRISSYDADLLFSYYNKSIWL